MKENICVGLVTYNRLEKLKKALSSYDCQTFKPSRIIVFDNNSTDGTIEYLKKWEKEKSDYEKIVIYNDENIGGSGGFSRLIANSLKYTYDWLFISDDDAYLEKDCLKKLNKYSKTLKNDEVVMCTSVHENGNIAYQHRRRVQNTKFNMKLILSDKSDYEKERFYIDMFSFVGTAIKKEAIEDVGIPEEDFFIWADDGEYSLRFNRKYKILCFPSIIVTHDVDVANYQLSWKNYYRERNYLYMVKKHCTKLQYIVYRIKYNLREIRAYFQNKKFYFILREGKKDFKNHNFGLSKKYYPGCKM